MPPLIEILLDDIQQLLNKDYMEYVLYYIHFARFELLGNVFLMQLKFIYNKYQEGYTILC